MLNKRTVFLEAWEGQKTYVWAERSFANTLALKREYAQVFMFNGQTAVVYIGTNEDEMRREDALKIATDHIKGNYNVLRIDLAVCGTLPKRLWKKTPQH